MFYEYVCEQCGESFDQWERMHDAHTAICRVCGHPAARVYGNVSFKIDWVNGGWHGDGLNLGVGGHYKSAAERDYAAAEQGLVKSPEL